MNIIDKARESLKQICKQLFKDSTFQNYIDNHLAGDFAVEINDVVTNLSDKVGKLTRQRDLAITSRDTYLKIAGAKTEEVKQLQEQLNGSNLYDAERDERDEEIADIISSILNYFDEEGHFSEDDKVVIVMKDIINKLNGEK